MKHITLFLLCITLFNCSAYTPRISLDGPGITVQSKDNGDIVVSVERNKCIVPGKESEVVKATVHGPEGENPGILDILGILELLF